MFGKWKRVKKRAKEINGEEEQELEELEEKEGKDVVRYIWPRSLSMAIHARTFSLICIVSALTVCHLKFYGQYHLWTSFWKDAVFCILAELLTICWAICWWGQIHPKLLASKGSMREAVSELFLILATTVVFALLVANMISNSPSAFAPLTLVLICFGGRTAVDFYVIWKDYKDSSYYKRISFIDYCNLSRSE